MFAKSSLRQNTVSDSPKRLRDSNSRSGIPHPNLSPVRPRKFAYVPTSATNIKCDLGGSPASDAMRAIHFRIFLRNMNRSSGIIRWGGPAPGCGHLCSSPTESMFDSTFKGGCSDQDASMHLTGLRCGCTRKWIRRMKASGEKDGRHHSRN